MTLWSWPTAAAFGRVVPKSKIYDHAGANTALKDRFVTEVDQITWAYKLAPETVNLAASPAVPEIQVFTVTLRTAELDNSVLAAIDRAVAFPVVFELGRPGERRMVAAYKQLSGDSRAVSPYFSTVWQPQDARRRQLPVALSLASLYDAVVAELLPLSQRAGESLPERINRIAAADAQAAVVERIVGRLSRERQFNRRVTINSELKAARAELERLRHS